MQPKGCAPPPEVSRLHDAVKQLAPLAKLHHDVNIVLVLMGGLEKCSGSCTGVLTRIGVMY